MTTHTHDGSGRLLPSRSSEASPWRSAALRVSFVAGLALLVILVGVPLR